MCTYEIDQTMKQHNYNLPSDVYSHICDTSPQITHIKYNAWDSLFEISTSDGGYWKFYVYYREEGEKG